MARTIGTIESTPLVLDSSWNPLGIDAAGGVVVTGADAITGPAGQPWTIVNAGTVSGSNGIVLAAGGTIGNAAGGSIRGTATYAVDIRGATGMVTNAGTIRGFGGSVILEAGGSVTNQAGGIIDNSDTYSAGIYITGGTGSVVNAGTIAGGNGVVFTGAGTIDNQAGGLIGTADTWLGIEISGGGLLHNGGIILSNYWAVILDAADSRLENAGTLTGWAWGAKLLAGGSISNAAGALLTTTDTDIGSWAISIAGGPGTVSNAGTIYGNTDAVVLAQGGSVSNSGTITGTRNVGVYIAGGGTVTNTGTIIGGSSGAVQFAGSADDRLVIDAGAVFQGQVSGGGGTNTLELSGTAAGTLSGLGSQFLDFSRIVVDDGANWTLAAANVLAPGTVSLGAGSTLTVEATLAAGETILFGAGHNLLALGDPTHDAAIIAGFVTGDTIVLNGVADATAVSVVNANTVAVTRSGGPAIDLVFDPAASLAGASFHVTTQGGNASITADDLACFAAGTRLATATGARAVEDLRPGDMLHTAGGGLRPVRWIGHRHIDLARHPAPDHVAPIRIAAGAVADGIPVCDLRLSPDHAVLLDGMLVPIRLLVNQASIRREAGTRAVTYFHVELDRHDILLAEGLGAESYLDTGNRATFENAGLPLRLHPDLAGDQARRAADSCAPFANDATRVEPLWQRLARRAAQHGLPAPQLPTTPDPALVLRLADELVHPVSRRDGCHVFMLPRGARQVRLLSRRAIPADRRPWVDDRRWLGVMLSRLTWRAGRNVETIPLDHPTLEDGWWAVERHGPAMRRWTDGDAALALPDQQPGLLEVRVAATLDYAVSCPEHNRYPGAHRIRRMA